MIDAATGGPLTPSCDERARIPLPRFYWNAVGVQLIWLNAAEPVVCRGEEIRSQSPPHLRLRCHRVLRYRRGNEAWRRLMSKNINYYIGLDASAYSTPSTAVDKTVNALNEPILHRIETSGLFHLETGIAEHDGILILKRVDRDQTTSSTDGRCPIVGSTSRPSRS